MNRVLKAVAVAIFSVCVVSWQLQAGVVNITQGSTSGYTMTDGNTYVIKNSVSFSNSTAGGSGMSVADNATVVLYIPTGVTLSANGANGTDRTGGGSGIAVSSSSTLIITGEGALNATGGNAGNGGNGSKGGNGGTISAGSSSATGTSGAGGAGGDGGGGGGAGIGGCGGNGGTGGSGAAGIVRKNASHTSFGGDGGKGGNGGGGGNALAMGNVYVIGSVVVTAAAGQSGNSGSAGGYGSLSKGNKSIYYYGTCGGGGGGGGGAGSAAAHNIGGGGSAGGGGGGGGSGATCSALYNECSKNGHGGGGNGGASKTSKGGTGVGKDSCQTYYGGNRTVYGGDGGAGGNNGTAGADGLLFTADTASVSTTRAKLSATTHSAAQYTIIFNANGGQFSSAVELLTATLGCVLPDCIPAPTRRGYLFDGWRTAAGEEYYGTSGAKSMSSYPVVGNVTLYAQWQVDETYVDHTVTTPEEVPYSYFDNDYPTLLAEHGGDYEAAALATAANGHNKVWECFVAGISPTNETSSFVAKIEMVAGMPIVTWDPDLNTNGVVRTYKVYGKETLEAGGEWQYPTNSLHRFFKVEVGLP